MKRIRFFGLLAIISFLAFLGTAATGDARKEDSPPATEVSIDGMSFRTEESFSSDSTLLRRELEKLGVHPPKDFILSEDPGLPGPAISGRVIGPAKPRYVSVQDVPSGLAAEHKLRMKGSNQTVEITVGKTESGGRYVSDRLKTGGWFPVSLDGKIRPIRMLQLVRGKETAVVCLDETKGTFLLLRKLER